METTAQSTPKTDKKTYTTAEYLDYVTEALYTISKDLHLIRNVVIALIVLDIVLALLRLI